MLQLALFDELEKWIAPRRKRKPRLWAISDHSCRHCMGRVLVNGAMARCSECGAEAEGGHEALCWCGVDLPGHGRMFECFHNPEQTLASPNQILVREREDA